MGYEKEAYLYVLFHYTGKKICKSTPKIQMLMLGLAQASHFGLWDIIPSESQLAFHIYYVKYENTLTCKRISWDSWGGEWCFKNIFLFPICIMQKVSILVKNKAVHLW